MNSTPNPTATEPDDVVVVHADERQAHAYQQIARADYQQIAHAEEQVPRVTKYTPTPKAARPNDVLIARADEEAAYEQIAGADEQLAHGTEQLRLEREQPVVQGRRPSGGRPALRGLVGLLLAACIFAAAFAWQSPYGDAARQMVARWAPGLVSPTSAPLKKAGVPVQSSASGAQAVVAEPTRAQPTPSAEAATQESAPTADPLSPELAQMLQTMARDLANVEHGIEQLKTTQEQMASDNARLIAQLKASQEQMAGFIANASRQNQQPKTSAPPSRPIAAPTR